MTISIQTANRVTVLSVFALLGLAGQAQALCVDGTTTQCTAYGHPGTRECVNGYWTPCDTGVPGPASIAAPSFPSRTSTTITVNWNGTVQAGQSYQLQYYAGGWVGLTNVGSPATYVHYGRQPDTKYCYRIYATGSFGARSSSSSCRYTTDGTNRKVWRLQIEFHTGTPDDANTDDSINVSVTESGGNLTWVDYGRDDFERGDTFTYDLNLNALPALSEINRIRISKTGTDGWCLADFRLLVNERPVYAENFHSLPSGCRWIDGNDGHQPTYEVNHATLRASSAWQGYIEPIRVGLEFNGPTVSAATLHIPRVETESRIESMLGHVLHGTQAHWGDRHGPGYVEAFWQGFADRISVDLDLEASVDYWFDPELDIDFDLRYTAQCSADQTQAIVGITTQNLQAEVDFDWFAELFSTILPCGPVATIVDNRPIPDCISALEDYIEDRIESAFQPIVLNQQQTLPAGYRCVSGSVVIDADANVDLVFQLQPPAPAPSPTPIPILPILPIRR